MPEKNDYTTPIKIFSADGVLVLTASFTLPHDLLPKCEYFYGNIIEAIRNTVCENLADKAKLAYEACGDRRKRYRYKPWTVSVCVKRCDEHISFKLTKNGELLISERHFWRDDLLIKRTSQN